MHKKVEEALAKAAAKRRRRGGAARRAQADMAADVDSFMKATFADEGAEMAGLTAYFAANPGKLAEIARATGHDKAVVQNAMDEVEAGFKERSFDRGSAPSSHSATTSTCATLSLTTT